MIYEGFTPSRQHFKIEPQEGDIIHKIDEINKYLVNNYKNYKDITIYFVDEVRAKINTKDGRCIKLKYKDKKWVEEGLK